MDDECRKAYDRATCRGEKDAIQLDKVSFYVGWQAAWNARSATVQRLPSPVRYTDGTISREYDEQPESVDEVYPGYDSLTMREKAVYRLAHNRGILDGLAAASPAMVDEALVSAIERELGFRELVMASPQQLQHLMAQRIARVAAAKAQAPLRDELQTLRQQLERAKLALLRIAENSGDYGSVQIAREALKVKP